MEMTEAKDREEVLQFRMKTFEEEDDGEDDGDGDHRLLTRLLSQLESRKDDDRDLSGPSTEIKALASSGSVEAGAKDETGSEAAEIGIEEIVKELRIVRRQNTITHWLLSVMIVVTALWQMSEVSLILYLRDRVKHPFRALGGLIVRPFGRSNEPDSTKSNSSSKNEPLPLPHQIKMPEFPSMDLSSLGLNDNED